MRSLSWIGAPVTPGGRGRRGWDSNGWLGREARATLVLACVLVGAPGCFNYIPVELGSITPGEEVRVQLSRGGMLDLQQTTDAVRMDEGYPVLEGVFMGTEGDRALVRVPVFGPQVGAGLQRSRLEFNVPVPQIDVVRVERKEIDKLKTGLAVGGTLAGLAILSFGILDLAVQPATGPGPTPPSPEEARVPAFSIPFFSIPAW